MTVFILRRIAVCAIAGLAIASGYSTVAGAAQTAQDATHYYLDCAAGDDANSGTSPLKPWKTLAKASSVTLGTGDTLSLKADTSCAGVLTPQGSGTADSPITINGYGSGAKPKIVAPGARAALYLHNVQGYEIRDLDVSNPGSRTSDPRTGIYVENTNFGKGSHYVVDGVTVHDVVGCDCTNPGQPSGGVLFNADGDSKLTSFADIKITNNTVKHVDGIGIGTSSLWAKRDVYPGGPGTAFGPITGLVVEGNSLSDLGGDGINITNGVDALVQHNVIAGFGLRASTDHAGAWAWNSDRTLVQYNDISGGDAGSYGAFAFDVDGGNTGTIYQYNLSRNNSGFMLLCSIDGLSASDQTVRYNISQNDRDVSGGMIVFACAKQTDPKLYNNTFYAPKTATFVKNLTSNEVKVTNNIFYGGGASIVDEHGNYGYNAYRDITDAPNDAHKVVGEPKFVSPGKASGLDSAGGYKLKLGSPALRTGATLSNNGGKDFFGHAVPPRLPNIGAYQGPGVS